MLSFRDSHIPPRPPSVLPTVRNFGRITRIRRKKPAGTGDKDIQIDAIEPYREGQRGGGQRGCNCPEVEFLVLFFICI
jgi:hypothetical protein